MTARVVLTGASGFVGKAVLAALIEQGADVMALSRRRPDVKGPFAWRPCDLLDAGSAEEALRGVETDVLVHAAWTVEHGKFWTAPANLDWVGASLRLLRLAAETGVRRFVGLGTCFEYGWPDDGNCDERSTALEPATLYAASKDATRRVAERFCLTNDISFAWARLFFLYGQGEARTRLVPALALAMLEGLPARIDSGRAVRDFMDVGDAGRALAGLALSGTTGSVNVASGQGASIGEIAGMVADIIGRPDLVSVGALPDRVGEGRRCVASTSRLVEEVGFAPQSSLRQGLERAVEHWRGQVRSGAGD